MNERFARQFFPGEDPVGQVISGCVIIGVVNNATYRNMRDTPPTFYGLMNREGIEYSDGLTIYARVAGRTGTNYP